MARDGQMSTTARTFKTKSDQKSDVNGEKNVRSSRDNKGSPLLSNTGGLKGPTADGGGGKR